MTDSTSCPPCRARAPPPNSVAAGRRGCRTRLARACRRLFQGPSLLNHAERGHPSRTHTPVTPRRRAAAGRAGRARLRLGGGGVQVGQRHVLDHLLLLVHVALRARRARCLTGRRSSPAQRPCQRSTAPSRPEHRPRQLGLTAVCFTAHPHRRQGMACISCTWTTRQYPAHSHVYTGQMTSSFHQAVLPAAGALPPWPQHRASSARARAAALGTPDACTGRRNAGRRRSPKPRARALGSGTYSSASRSNSVAYASQRPTRRTAPLLASM